MRVFLSVIDPFYSCYLPYMYSIQYLCSILLSAYLFIKCISFVHQVECYSGEQVTLVRLRTPLGTSVEYLGAWGNEGPEWESVQPREKERLNLKYLADGEFW